VRTERLLLRRWVAEDLEPLAAMNADREVMEHFPATLARDESELLLGRIEAHFHEHGYGLWAIELPGEARFAGFAGLGHVDPAPPFTPAVELAWRLARRFWGRGIASEAARAAARCAFEAHGLRELVAFASPRNARSIAVMERLGMARDPDGDFEHPHLPAGHPLRAHVLYRLPAARMLDGCAAATRTPPALKS
jgi:RimJ/RimL family protein N-acetyltransferase